MEATVDPLSPGSRLDADSSVMSFRRFPGNKNAVPAAARG